MIELEKSIYINELYDLYGSLLTKKQQEIIELYYCDDLSLSEISEQLENYEKNLKLYQKAKELDEFFNELKIKRPNDISLIEEIERRVK